MTPCKKNSPNRDGERRKVVELKVLRRVRFPGPMVGAMVLESGGFCVYRIARKLPAGVG
jgi:hypothetical protein